MAALLSDQIDRLAQRTRSIKATAVEIATVDPNKHLFTHAVLYAELGDLIRDSDSTELGLFTLEQSSAKSVPFENASEGAQIKRIDFVGATPLRRNPPRRDDRAQDHHPEVYAQAALKCLHRYQTIRPMPRAKAQLTGILERLESTRASIETLQFSLQKHQVNTVETVPKRSQIKEEEDTIASLQARMGELNRRKQQFSTEKPAKPTPRVLPEAQPASPQDKFWSTPAEAPRTLTFAPNLLLDETADFNDLSDTSFSMPTPQKGASTAPFSRFETMEVTVYEDIEEPRPTPPPAPFQETLSAPIPSAEEDPDDELVQPDSPPAVVSNVDTSHAAPTKSKSGLIRITPEVDRIAAKMVSVYADVLQLPRSPDGKGIVARLKELSNQVPSPESPSQSSLSAGGGSHGVTVQQVLTAFVLFELLSAPKHTLSMTKLKDALATKTKSNGLSVSALGQNPSRIVYACVAKRLLKFDRTGKEQMIQFDI